MEGIPRTPDTPPSVLKAPVALRPGLFIAATAAALLVRTAACLRYGKVDAIFIGKRRLLLRYFW